MICAATAATGKLEVSTFDGTKWSPPTTVAAVLFSGPSCAELPAAEVLCVARNASGGLAWSVFNGTTWSAFANLATTAVSGPSCTSDNNNGVVCAIFTTGGGTLVNRFIANKWQGFLKVGGIAGGEPDCTSLNSAGEVMYFAKAYNSGLEVPRHCDFDAIVLDVTECSEQYECRRELAVTNVCYARKHRSD